MSGDSPEAPRFSYRVGKDDVVSISSLGRVVTTLKGKDASRFLGRIDQASEAAGQLLMARATGQFKFGNERVAKQRGRGQPGGY